MTRQEKIDAAIACIVVLIFHYVLLIVARLALMSQQESSAEEVVLKLTFLKPAKPGTATQERVAAKPQARIDGRAAITPVRVPRVSVRSRQVDNLGEAAKPSERNDAVSGKRLNLTITEPEIDFQRSPISMGTSRVKNEPDRFPMRKPVSGKDVIEGAAKLLGFWPPGYTRDPCPEIEQNIRKYMADIEPASRKMLEEDIRMMERHCM